MPQFIMSDKQFWLDGAPLFLQAGEFHYFRTPVDAWEHRLSLLREAGFNAVAAYIPWLWHQPEPDVTDLDGHTRPMRDLAGFLDLAARMDFYIIARPGPYIMAETINEGIPPWVFARHPQAALVRQDGKIENIVSYLHPDYLRCVDSWYAEVFRVLAPRQITRGGKIVLVQLDNEMGMIHWLRNAIDTNPDTLARFAAYLREMQGDLSAEMLGERITRESDGALVDDYRRFFRGYLREYAMHLWARAKAHGLEVPPVINIHGFGNGGKTFPIGLSQLVEVMALDGMVSATDVYPLHIDEGNVAQLVMVNEMTKALHNQEQPLFSIEFQAGGNPDFGGAQSSLYDLHSRLCISVGMRAINHYLFFDGENDPALSPVKRHDWGHPVRKDGTLRRHYARYPMLARALAAYGDALTLSRPKTVTTIGFPLDAYMTEVNNALTKPATDILTHQRDVILFDFLARGLVLTHRPFDALELSRATLDPAWTPTLFAMMEKQCDAAVQQKLADYVNQGGKLALVGRMCAETFDHAPCTILQDALDIRSAHDDPPFTPALIHAFDHRDAPVSFLEAYSGDVGDVFARSADGQPVGFVKRVGRGEVMVFGAALAANTLDDLDILRQMAARMGVASLFSLTEWADVRLSEGENGSFLFVNNYQDDPVETRIAVAGAPLLGGHALSLPARRGLILPLEWRARPGVIVHWLTSEVIDVIEDGARLTFRTEAPEFHAEVSLTGYRCDESIIVARTDEGRLTLRGREGQIVLIRE